MAALWVVCAAVAVAPSFAPFGSIAPYDQERILQVGACAAALLVSAFGARSRRDVTVVVSGTSRLLRSGLAGAFALGSLSAALSPHPRAAFVEVAELALVALAVFAVAGAVRAEKSRALDLAALAIGASALLAVADLAIRIAALETAAVAPVRPSALFERFQNPRFFAQWMTWVLPLLALVRTRARTARAGRKLLEATVWATWSTAWAFAFLAAGRGTFAAQAAATVIVLFVFGREAIPWLTAYGAAAFAGVALYFASALVFPHTWSQLSEIAARLASFSDSGRFEIWRATLRMIAAAPLLGAGPRAMAYDVAMPVAHPHCSLLQWASEWGLPAALLAACALICGLSGWIRRQRARHSAGTTDTVVVVSIAAALVGAAIHSLVCGVLVMPISQLMLVLTAGCALGIDSNPRARAIEARWWPATVALVVLVWVAASRVEMANVLAWKATPDILELRLRPRIWHDESSILTMRGATQPAHRPVQRP